MRAKFIALSFCYVSIAHCGLVKDLVEGKNVECTTSKEPSRPSDLAISEAKSSIHRDPNQCHTEVVYSSPTTSLDVERARRENQNQLLGLDQDSQELSAMKLQINKKSYELRLLLKYYPNDHFRVFYDAFNVLTEVSETLIVNLEQLKLFDEPRIDSVELNSNLINLMIPRKRGQSQDFSTLPADQIIQLINQKSWLNDGNSIVEKLKSLSRDLIFDSTSISESKTFKLWWECELKTMDFLFKYKFADKSIIGSFFQDNYIIEQVIQYIALRYEEDLGVSLLRRTPYLTEHWYWSLLHESFQAVTKKQEIIFNGHVLLTTRHMIAREQCRKYDSDIPSYKFTVFFESFDSERYMKRLLALDRTHRSHSHEDAVDDPPTKIKLDVERLMNLIAISTIQLRLLPSPAQKIIMLHISELLDFITRFVYPGIIEKIPINQIDFDEFDAKFNAMLIFSKLDSIDASAHDYFEYIQKQSPSDWFESKVYKSKFDAYLNQAIHLQHEHQVERLRLKKEIGNPYFQSSSENAMNRLEIMLQDSLNDLKKKIEKFS